MNNNETTEGRAANCFGQIAEDPVAAPRQTYARYNAARVALLNEIDHEEREEAWATEHGYNFSAARHAAQREKYARILSIMDGAEEA